MKLASAALIVASIALVVLSVASGLPAVRAVAYVKGAASSPDVWMADADGGNARKLGKGTQPLLAPNGLTVAASSAGSSGQALTLYSTDGSSPRRFFDAARVTAHAQAWSPDSRYVAVVLASTDPSSDAASGLALIDTSSDRLRFIARGQVDGASFAPSAPDRVVWASAGGTALSAQVDVYAAAADGAGRARLTHDGRSLNPVWGRSAIAFDHEQLRPGAAPVYQIWLMAPDGSGRRQITRLSVPPLIDGLVPTAFSTDGSRLLAEYEGQNTSQAWIVTPADDRARMLEVGGETVTGGGVARGGLTVLVDRGGFLNAADDGTVESLPLAGGPATVIIPHASEPSWNL